MASVVLSRPWALARTRSRPMPAWPGDVELRGVGARLVEALADDLLRPVHGRRRLHGHVRRGEADLDEGATAVLAEEAFAEERLAVGDDAARSEGPARSPSACRGRPPCVHEAEVGLGERGVGCVRRRRGRGWRRRPGESVPAAAGSRGRWGSGRGGSGCRRPACRGRASGATRATPTPRRSQAPQIHQGRVAEKRPRN